jgi:hypothetical protein
MSFSKQEEHRRQVPKEDDQKQRREKSSTRNEHHREGRKVNTNGEMESFTNPSIYQHIFME